MLWLQKCWRQKNRQVSNSVASSKKLEPENLDAITCSYKIVLRQECKFYHSWRHGYTPALKSWYCCSITGYMSKGLIVTFIMIFSVILDILFTLGPFSYWKWNRNFVRTTGSLPTACKQRMNPDICYGLWPIVIDTKIFSFQMISTISWLIKCMLSIWRLNLFI